MAANPAVSRPNVLNRRRRVRHKIQTPAYVIFTGDSNVAMLDLHEIVDISEDGVAIQCHSPLDPEMRVNLCLDLADFPTQIRAVGHVIWMNSSGRAGLRFEELPSDSLVRLREWLFINVMAGVANSEVDLSTPLTQTAPHPNFTDTLAAVTAVQRQVEALGSDLAAALRLIAERSQSLLHASGAAVALSDADPDFMICRASAGDDAPPIGARLQVGSGFSGECVKTGMLLRCDDAENDVRVDRESCRALGIRSILAAPVRVGDKTVGLVEAFSPQPNAFSEGDGRALQRLADTVLAAVNRSVRAENLPPLTPLPPPRFAAPQGSVLFAAEPDSESDESKAHEKLMASLSLSRSHLFLLTCAFAAVSLSLGFVSAPWIQSDVIPWMQHKLRNHAQPQLETVLASSRPPKSDVAAVETATLDQLRQMAENGDPVAQNALGLRYATGDGVVLNEEEAVQWFIKSAERGNVSAQSKLGSIYYSGRGVPQDPNRAYFWMVVARMSGDDASKTLAPFVRARLTRSQVASIEQDAGRWLQQHSTIAKPVPGQMKSSL